MSLEKFCQWMEQLQEDAVISGIPCDEYCPQLSDYFSQSFLKDKYIVISEQVPRPPLEDSVPLSMSQLLSSNLAGIALERCYFLKPEYASDVSVNVHELVHLLQWHLLGREAFVNKYLFDIEQYGYRESPLEKMAFHVQSRVRSGERFSVESYLVSELTAGRE